MLCIYHIADHDGKGSAAIVKSVYPETELLGLNHDMEIPYDEIKREIGEELKEEHLEIFKNKGYTAFAVNFVKTLASSSKLILPTC